MHTTQRHSAYLFSSSGKVDLCYPHPSFSESQQTSLGTHRLDISTRQIVLGRDELLQVDVVGERHTRCM